MPEEKKTKRTSTLINGKEPVQIINVVRDDKMELKILFKFKGDEELQFIPASVANIKVPQMVIKFYEKHVCFDPDILPKSANNNK